MLTAHQKQTLHQVADRLRQLQDSIANAGPEFTTHPHSSWALFSIGKFLDEVGSRFNINGTGSCFRSHSGTLYSDDALMTQNELLEIVLGVSELELPSLEDGCASLQLVSIAIGVARDNGEFSADPSPLAPL